MSDAASPLGPRGIVYFGNDWFAENRTSSHHIAERSGAVATRAVRRFARACARRRASGRDCSARCANCARALQAAGRASAKDSGTARCRNCRSGAFPVWKRFNRWFGRWAVRARDARMPVSRERISWFVVPHPGFMAGQSRRRSVCVLLHRRLRRASRRRPALIGAARRGPDREADLVFVAPPSLVAESKRALNPNTDCSRRMAWTSSCLAARGPADTSARRRARSARIR